MDAGPMPAGSLLWQTLLRHADERAARYQSKPQQLTYNTLLNTRPYEFQTVYTPGPVGRFRVDFDCIVTVLSVQFNAGSTGTLELNFLSSLRATPGNFTQQFNITVDTANMTGTDPTLVLWDDSLGGWTNRYIEEGGFLRINYVTSTGNMTDADIAVSVERV